MRDLVTATLIVLGFSITVTMNIVFWNLVPISHNAQLVLIAIGSIVLGVFWGRLINKLRD